MAGLAAGATENLRLKRNNRHTGRLVSQNGITVKRLCFAEEATNTALADARMAWWACDDSSSILRAKALYRFGTFSMKRR